MEYALSHSLEREKAGWSTTLWSQNIKQKKTNNVWSEMKTPLGRAEEMPRPTSGFELTTFGAAN